MAEHRIPQPAHAPTDNLQVRHETSDINIRGVFLFAAGLFVSAILIGFMVWVLFRYLDTREAHKGASEFPLAAAQGSRVPPAPRLQTNPREDLRELRAREDRALTSYGWVDKNAGVVRIPIDQAMKLAVERGLPSRRAQGSPP